MADQKNPKDPSRDFGSGGDKRDRVTGPQGAPNRDRNTGSISNPRPTTTHSAVTSASGSGARPQDRERSTGSISMPPGERERATAPMKPIPLPKTTGKINVSHLMKGGGGGTQSGVSNPGATTGPKQLTEHQKRMLGSAFQDSKRMQAMKVTVGNTGERRVPDDDDDEPTALGPLFDGVTPARELTGRDLFKTVQAPIQSREGRRGKEIYRQVINQFAVGNNPRYPPDGPDKPRAHIFIWDVSRAMNCEVPHFISVKELSLGQTVDWLRHEGPTRGWMRANPEDALNAALQGLMVVAMPKEIRLKQLAIVIPEPPDKDGRPRLAGAAVKIGNNLSLYEALGVYAADFFIHA
jgi:hypothetical protein